MARMYPRTLLDAEVKSDGEKRVFAALRHELGDEWEVFHSASVVVKDHARGASDDECDFVLCHPERGMVCLEVKGGPLDCQHGEWRRNSERIPDPFTQAIDHAWSLRRKIDEVDGWRGKDLFLVHAVAFPDITVHKLALAPDAPRKILLDRNDVRDDITGAIDRVLTFHEGSRDKRKAPGEAGATMLRDLLAPRISIRVPLAEEFLREEEELILLTRDQSALLSRFGRAQKMVVTGCAGSGKTMLAVEQAKRLAASGKDVLFVCFNKALAEHLKAREGCDRVTFQTFHGACTRWARVAEVALPTYPKGEAPPEFFREELPDALVEAMGLLGGQYDAVIVDEAQDLHDDWLAALSYTLHDEATGVIWLFMDDNQRVYDTALTVPDDFFPFDLTVNCRNTQSIHREVMKLYEGVVMPDVMGPAGRDIELHHADDQAAKVAGVLERLCGREEVSPQDVVVLSSHSAAKSEVAKRVGGRFALTDKRGKLGPNVYFSSIRGFKGLESPVVVLCELEDLDDLSKTHQLYVGLSRARNHCVVVAPPAAS